MTGPGPTWEAVIGLEIHVQLATASKAFSASAVRFNASAAPMNEVRQSAPDWKVT